MIVMTLPNLSLAPAYLRHPYKAVKESVAAHIKEFNENLRLRFSSNALHMSGSKVLLIDVSVMFEHLFHSGHFANNSEPAMGTYLYPDPKGHFWWDKWHPSTFVHKEIADFVRDNLLKVRT